ncbi:MAG: OmpA family protein [Vicinamibacterales bacterium]
MRNPVCLRLAASVVALAALGAALAAQSTPANKRRLGPEVNTEELREGGPIVSADGSTLYFLREDQGQALAASMNAQADAALADFEKALALVDPATRAQMEASLREMRQTRQQPVAIGGFVHQTPWVSRRGPDGRWQPAEKLPPPLSDDVATVWIGSVLPDNNTLLVGGDVAGNLLDRFKDIADRGARSDSVEGFLSALAKQSGGDTALSSSGETSQVFAWSTRAQTGWSSPTPLRMRQFEHNASRLEIMLAPDGRHLLLAIRNRDANGEHDLFVSTLGSDDVWSKPANLGANVNSPARECSPFMAPDDRTLYFCSNRPGGLGGYDFYVTRRLDESWLKWSDPVNMGAEINTPQDDISLSVDASGRFAFMAIGPLMKEDIYEFELPPALRPRPVAFVWGRVTDPTGKPLPASVVYEFLRTGEGAGQAAAQAGDGSYQIALPIGEDYGFRASAAGYVAISDRLDLTAAKDQQRIERNLVLVPLEVGRPIRLNNVFFDTAKTELRRESERELDRLVALMNSMPSLRIEVRGHTDSVDDDAFNMTLSQGRAAAVVNYLIAAGVAAGRMEARGFGETSPIGTNATEEGRTLNRRVEFVVVAR